MNTQILLQNPEIHPSDKVLEESLGKPVYSIYKEFRQIITNDEYSLSMEWRYYNDGKAWLNKITYKKKTILWLSIWGGFFKTSFYFHERHVEAITASDISETIKYDFYRTKHIGRLIPMIIDINKDGKIKELLTVIKLKKNLK